MAKIQTVDFSGVKDRGDFNPKRVNEGDYRAKIVKVEDGETKQDKEFQYIFTFKLEKYSQYSYPYYCKVQDNQLWKIRNLLIAAGINVPKKKVKLDPNRVLNKTVGVTMADDEYEGKMKSVIDAVFPVSELADGVDASDEVDDVPDDEPELAAGSNGASSKASKKKSSKKGKKGKKAKKDSEELDLNDL